MLKKCLLLSIAFTFSLMGCTENEKKSQAQGKSSSLPQAAPPKPKTTLNPNPMIELGANSPQEAVKSFIDGIIEGDKQRVVSVLDQSTEGAKGIVKIISCSIDMMVLGTKFKKNLESKFGPEFTRELPPSLFFNVDKQKEMAERFSRGKLEMGTDEATLVFPQELEEKNISIKKVGAKWVIQNLNSEPPRPEHIQMSEGLLKSAQGYFSNAQVLLDNTSDPKQFKTRLVRLFRQVSGGRG